MKKTFVFLLALGLALAVSCPVQAQEKTMEERVKALEQFMNGWTIYGSIRFGTFYNQSDDDFTGDTYGVTRVNSGNTPTITEPDQEYTQWALANNSRIGFQVENISNFGGRVELGLRNDGNVYLRHGYGTYALGDLTLLWGQDYTPLSDWDYSTQAYFSDNNLHGWGIITVDGKRIPQVKAKWKGIEVALVHPKGANDLGLPDGANASTEVLVPTLMAKYRLKTDMFFADIFGGAGTYTVKSEVLDIDEEVTSYAAGVGGGVTLDPVYVKGMVWMARNGEEMSLSQADATGASLDMDGSLIDDDSFGWAVIVGVKIARITVEAGYGFVSSEPDVSGSTENEAQNYYANVTIPVVQTEDKTKALILVPEVGVYDYMDDEDGNDQGTITYAGAKWQVNF